MFGRIKEKSTQIKVVITKTSTQAQYEKDISNEANKRSELCPNCGCKSELNVSTYPMNIGGTNILVIHSHCIKCSTEWETRYSY